VRVARKRAVRVVERNGIECECDVWAAMVTGKATSNEKSDEKSAAKSTTTTSSSATGKRKTKSKASSGTGKKRKAKGQSGLKGFFQNTSKDDVDAEEKEAKEEDEDVVDTANNNNDDDDDDKEMAENNAEQQTTASSASQVTEYIHHIRHTHSLSPSHFCISRRALLRANASGCVVVWSILTTKTVFNFFVLVMFTRFSSFFLHCFVLRCIVECAFLIGFNGCFYSRSDESNTFFFFIFNYFV